jgi:CheY-like chemotaxis protein
MSRPSPFEQLAAIRDEARILVQRAGDHVDELQTLVAAADTQVRHAEGALSDALDGTHQSVEHLRSLLSAHLRRSQDGAETARQLCAGAHEQRVAAGLMLRHLQGHVGSEQVIERRSRRDTVLIVDDYGAIREGIAEVIRNAGFVVRTAANGLEGLLAAHEMRPAVIIMDLTMPVLDGITATRLIKAGNATCQTRVIAYTADSAFDGSLAQTLFTAVVEKSVTPAALLATVQRVVNL